MLRSYRRYWFLVLTALLMAPPVSGLLGPFDGAQFPAERRTAADWPGFPRSKAAWIALPKQIDAYLGDHFGLRSELIRTRAILAHHVLGDGNGKALGGRDGRLFYRLESMLEQSAGHLVREPIIHNTADVVASIHTALTAKGIKFIFASPPNSATIYPLGVPGWARNQGNQTEYGLLLGALRERGVPVADLRPALNAAREAHLPVYRKLDTHWTNRGALIAFNAVASAAGHPDWVLDAQTAFGPAQEARGGDLADMLGLGTYLREQIEPLVLPAGKAELLVPDPFATFQSTLYTEKSGTLMVIGDSFTQYFFQPMVLANVGRFAWTHHQFCGFDWKWVEKFRPDEVWFMPTERFAICAAKPVGMPQAPRQASAGFDPGHSQ
jgi:alginate O-acetyltransferase complex protein AlgJ